MSPIIAGPLAVSLISAALALLIAVLDKLLNNYGILDISINGGKKKLSVKGGASLLSSLASENIFVPSACGGRGACGACKCKIASDVGPYLPTELPYLSAEEMAGQIRLACQIKVRKPLDIELPAELFSVRKFDARVEKIRDLTHDIKELLLDLGKDSSQDIDFKPGRYVQLVVPPYDKIAESNQRAYSISSSPRDTRHVELIIRLVPGGIATTWVHSKIKEGDKVQIIGPFGDFGVRDTQAAMVCVAGGSGMAPFKSIFAFMEEAQAWPGKEVWYFFGARTLKDMFYLDELRALETRMPRFHFIPALSEPAPEGGWKGESGLITDVLGRYLETKIDAAKGLEGYLCGSPGMINACIAVMGKHGIAEDKIYFDKFA